MTISKTIEHLSVLTSHITFKYKGKDCGIDPLSHNRFDMWYGHANITAKSVDEVFNVKFFDDKSLTDIWDDVTEFWY